MVSFTSFNVLRFVSVMFHSLLIVLAGVWVLFALVFRRSRISCHSQRRSQPVRPVIIPARDLTKQTSHQTDSAFFRSQACTEPLRHFCLDKTRRQRCAQKVWVLFRLLNGIRSQASFREPVPAHGRARLGSLNGSV